MTIQGTVHKTGIALILCIISAGYVWGNPSLHMLAMPAGILVYLAMVTAFKPTISHITVPVYAIVQGVFLGVISMIFDKMYPGIVVQAVFLTFGTLGALTISIYVWTNRSN